MVAGLVPGNCGGVGRVVVLTWYGLLRRPVGPWALLIGALAWLGLLGVVLAVVAPGGSYLASLPTLATAIAGIVAVTVPSRRAGLVAVCSVAPLP